MIRRSMDAQEGNTRCKGHQVDTMKTPSFPLFSRFPVGDEYLHSDRDQFVPPRLLMRYEVL